MPGSRRSNFAGSDVGGNRWTKFQNPSTDRFIAHIDATFCKHFLNVTKAQGKAKVEPDGPLDYYRRKSVAYVGYFAHSTTNKGASKRRIQQMIDLAFLAPDIVRDVLQGKQRLSAIMLSMKRISFVQACKVIPNKTQLKHWYSCILFVFDLHG
jgi:hypothetical protein